MQFDQKWSALARKWMYYLPPGRPSRTDLDIIQKEIEKRLSKEPEINALILGATPEFRDLLHRIGASITVVDRNPEMIDATTQLRLFDNVEIVHASDWFEFLPNNKRNYNLILSDFTQGNLPYERHMEFYKLISQSLTEDGYFIDRVLTFRESSPVYSSKELFKYFAKSPLNLVTLNEIMFQLFFASDLVCKWELVDINRMFAVMKEQCEKGLPLEKFITFLKEFIFDEGVIWYYGRTWSQISKDYFRYLNLVDEIPDQETVYSGFTYIIVTSPKV